MDKAAASRKLVTEEPEELPTEEFVEESIQKSVAPTAQVEPPAETIVPAANATATESVSSDAPTAPSASETSETSAPAVTPAHPAAIVETDDEILE